VRSDAKVYLLVSKLEMLLHGNVDFPLTNEVEMLIVGHVSDSGVVEYVSVFVWVSKLETLLPRCNSNWRRFSEGCSSVSDSPRELSPVDHGSLYVASWVEVWGCCHWKFRVKVQYTLYS
jgi:hypothetical protein